MPASRALTPSLAAVYDDLIAACDAHRADVVADVRRAFEARVSPFSPTDPWFEERSSALWDRVLVAVSSERPPHAALRSAYEPALVALASAQRGLFEVRPCPVSAGRTVDVTCAVSGAAFRLAESDETARAMAHTLVGGGSDGAHAGGGWIDGHVVATSEGVALLPGFLVHEAEASEPMRALVEVAAERGLSFEDLLDALLAMRHKLAARSRMKPKQIYRADALPAPRA